MYVWCDYISERSAMGEEQVVVLQAVAPYQPAPTVDRPLTGWVLAMSVLVAARLGRSAAETQRFDLSHLQVTPLLPVNC